MFIDFINNSINASFIYLAFGQTVEKIVTFENIYCKVSEKIELYFAVFKYILYWNWFNINH